ncbi:MAG: inositol monophosphatase [Gammaproteobacteria bacterium]|jgi:myo-inositol-1(or 4)-monophosphatase|nr:inositol monophosphatase [Gammaproteobacteria bacterium]
MHPMINIALKAARDAAEAIAHSSDRLDRIKIVEDSPSSFLTSMDFDSDKTLQYHLLKAYPDHSIDSRATGLKQGTRKDVVWLIDPLIGNRNFARGYTQFAVSLACQIDGVIQHAVVVCPMTNEEFVASRGGGAQLNSRRLRVGRETELVAGSLVGLNGEAEEADTLLAMQRAVFAIGARPRISGCTALDIVSTAADRLQGGWSPNEGGTNHSVKAAALILKEAGGLIGSELASPDIADARELLFSNPKIFKQLVKLRQAKADSEAPR